MSHRGVFRPWRLAEVWFRIERAGPGGAEENRVTNFDHENCVHRGAYLWQLPVRLAGILRAYGRRLPRRDWWITLSGELTSAQ
jgi:hypothetical protein